MSTTQLSHPQSNTTPPEQTSRPTGRQPGQSRRARRRASRVTVAHPEALTAALPPGPVRHIGLDVHAETITAAIAEPTGEVHLHSTIATLPEAVRKLMHTLQGRGHPLVVWYEAGPCGYWLWHLLTSWHIHCYVVAPGLIPQKAGDRIKNDPRDAQKLARLGRAGELTPVWVPDAAHEALRDLVRARADAVEDGTRAQHRLTKFLLRHGVRRPKGMNAWTTRHHQWLTGAVSQLPGFQAPALALTLQEYIHEVDRLSERVARYDAAIERMVATGISPERRAVIYALQACRGVQLVTAATIVSEVGYLSRFPRPARLMGYAGLGVREASSGGHQRRGGITKTGNAHLRRILVEAAWSYRFLPKLTPALKRRQVGLSEEVKAIAWAAQLRLHERYRRLLARGKPRPQVITALARELLGFLWAIGVEVERVEFERAAQERAEGRPAASQEVAA